MIEPDLMEIWVYLSATPLLGLTLTLVAYSLAYRLYQRSGGRPLLNPVVTSVALLIAVLMATGTRYETYFEGGQFVHFLLGPATVALAVPLYQQWARLRRIWWPLLAGLLAGSVTGALSALLIARGLGASLEGQLSLAPKSVTAPVAMGISEQIGGIPSLTAVLVVSTGILGAVAGTRLLSLIGIRDDSVKGVAMGVAAHGIGTARAFQVSQQMGAFSGLAMALSAAITALILPPLLSLFG
ncbi:LrgB family protein [Aestuariirhabdus litorea]|uniref:LrgB family protein n=1 Tax=Aestuariirhabdus litorea TaxID=2528527 RepID=A0A3P3VJZ5_9GAMM|nr:LrgB family protein [Aestuariirhabdus litorea]RRJ83042.1 LrgB family protein [Aestuariirhabdus litorea]RWW93200.1 LrgB family protein [Endozoicomonadaceae bacterium GTF-13]